LFQWLLIHFFKTWKRNSLSILAIALPTSLLAVFLIITIRFQGILYLTYIGQFIAFEVGVVQYTAIIVALIIAILTTAEIMWQNIADRKEEVALLKAVAWRNRHIRYLIWFEGLIIGLIAAIIALIIAFTITWVLYQQIPTEHLSFILLTGFIPLIVGVLGTIIPAERAVRMSPIKGLNRAS